MLSEICKIFACLVIFLTAGCGLLLPSYQADQVFVLAPQPIEFEPRSDIIPSTLLIEQSTASRYLDSQRLLYTKNGETLAAYQYALWSDPPTERLTGLMLRAFESRHAFEQVTSGNLFVRANYLLRTEITQAVHRTDPQPGVAVFSMRAQLLRFSTRELVASNLFTQQVDLQSFDAVGAVHALSVASEQVIRQLVVWTEEILANDIKEKQS